MRVCVIAGMLVLASGCGGGDDDAAPARSGPEQNAEFCTYFEVHRRESRQQLIGGLIKVAPAAIKDDLQAAHGMNEGSGYQSSKRIQAYIAEHCSDPAPEFSTP
jgi:hypothetical protein